jgi:hypothetical protein
MRSRSGSRRILNSLGQDDIYVDMTFAKVIDEKGLDATTEDFGTRFRDAKYGLWHANLGSSEVGASIGKAQRGSTGLVQGSGKGA